MNLAQINAEQSITVTKEPASPTPVELAATCVPKVSTVPREVNNLNLANVTGKNCCHVVFSQVIVKLLTSRAKAIKHRSTDESKFFTNH